ncbi:hypothetical protein [Pseudomonas fildesensis]|uniref:Uncharacterized protein n=1 Tax=Pseudomonas fildesensis TaxID=1674920 RepID=A0A0J8G3U7_9PSED|nr:hypothetical protein [Pseudomonas fildesensis]KMT57187.1 hypothetical protein ACR52_00830 [Pseudomonas fildesensis]
MAQGYINDKTIDYGSLKTRLMGYGLSRQRSDHFDVLNYHLRRGLVTSGQVRKRKQLWGPKPRFGRFHRMGLMIDLLLTSKRYVKEGLVTEAELASVPLSLKRWAVWPYRLTMIWIISWGY